jgi:catechol 2,3-dioxygenase-like lactoylglutathione lyase family enzyme
MAGIPEFVKPIPILPVRSVSASLRFYKDKLSFKGHGMPLPPADPVFGSVCRGKNADVNLYLLKVEEGSPVHPQQVYVMIAGKVMPGGATPEIDLLYDEMKGKGVFEGAEGDTQPANTQYSGYRQFDVIDPDGERLQFYRYPDDATFITGHKLTFFQHLPEGFFDSTST